MQKKIQNIPNREQEHDQEHDQPKTNQDNDRTRSEGNTQTKYKDTNDMTRNR